MRSRLDQLMGAETVEEQLVLIISDAWGEGYRAAGGNSRDASADWFESEIYRELREVLDDSE